MKNLFIIMFASFLILGCKSKYPVLVKPTPFPGSQFIVPNDNSKHTSIIMLHGSEGGSEYYLNSEANVLATQGYAVLLFCYFDCNRDITDPRETLKDVEVTKVLDAVSWLRAQSQSNKKVVVYGFSRGAELTMIIGSLPATDINRPNALVAHSPCNEFRGPINWNWYSHVCWICKKGIGKCPANSPKTEYQWNPSCGPDDTELSQDNYKSAWLISGTSIPAGQQIEIQKFNGPILITAGEKDELWPVTQTKNIEATLKGFGKKPEIHYFPNQGHMFKGDAEIARKELVLDFLQNLP